MFQSRCNYLTFSMVPLLSKEVIINQVSIECGFSLKHVRDTIRTHNKFYLTDKYSEHSSIIWPIWLNDGVLIYELSGCFFESR